MKNTLTLTALFLVCALAVPSTLPMVHAQTKGLPWTNRDRVLRAFDIDTAQSLDALEQTVEQFCGGDPTKTAEFTAALETNLSPPKTGAARVQALDEIKERVERELGADSPILTTISAEKETVATAIREEAVRQAAAETTSGPVSLEK